MTIAVVPEHVERETPDEDQRRAPATGEAPGRGQGREANEGPGESPRLAEAVTAGRPIRDAQQPDPPRPKAATIITLMPSANSELVVRGDVGKGNPDEWYGPRRVVHTPPLTGRQDYLVGAFWKDASGRPATRKNELSVEPGRVYEVDLRPSRPTWRELPRTR